MPIGNNFLENDVKIVSLTPPVIGTKCFYFQACKGGLVSESSFVLLEVSTTEPSF